MQGNKTVRINNRLYDAATGMPVDEAPGQQSAPAPVETPKPTPAVEAPKPTAAPVEATSAAAKPAATVTPKPKVPASEHHSAHQRSKTLHRRATKKPGPTPRPQAGRHMDIARSPKVSRFGTTIQPTVTEVAKPEDPIAPAQSHPTVKRALARVAQPMPVIAATPKQIKDAAIETALSAASAPASKAKKDASGTHKPNRFLSKRNGIIAAVVAVLLIIGGIVYANLPTISVGVAASQAGISATYPKFVPDGYSLSQPVTFKDKEVALVFKSNADLGEYKITQAESTWNSSAVLDNVVRKAAGENYVTNQERGLTIYSYDGNAAWVNAGILYTIDSTAPLSSDQIRRIAVSLS